MLLTLGLPGLFISCLLILTLLAQISHVVKFDHPLFLSSYIQQMCMSTTSVPDLLWHVNAFQTSVSQPWHRWHFGLCLGGCLAQFRIFSISIPGLYPLDVSSPLPQVGTTIDVSRHCPVSRGRQNHPERRITESTQSCWPWTAVTTAL